jgi:hypothetical protein
VRKEAELALSGPLSAGEAVAYVDIVGQCRELDHTVAESARSRAQAGSAGVRILADAIL